VRKTVMLPFSFPLLCTVCTLLFCAICIPPTASQEAPVFYGNVKLGITAISQDGDASSMIESYNLSKGLAIGRLLLNGKLGKHKTVSLDIENVTEHQMKGSLEFAAPGLFNLRLDGARLRYLQSGLGTPEFARESKGVSGNLTPQRWIKLYGGISFQEKHGDRVAVLSDGLDFPGTSYDYFTKTRSAGSQIRWKGRSVELGYEWRKFESERNSIFNRGGRKLRVSVSGPIVNKVSFSASFSDDKIVFEKAGDALHMKSYSGTLTLLPAKPFGVSGYVNHKNTEDGLTEITSHILTAGGKASIRLHTSLTTEGGYEYTRRTDEPETAENLDDPLESEAKRQISSSAVLAGMTARFSDKVKLTFRYRTQTTKRTKYEGLTGPFDTDNFLSRLEGWATPYVQYSVAFEDKERSNDELISHGRTRGVTAFVNLTPPSGQYPPSLRLSGSVFRSKFTELQGSFLTYNVLLSARLKYTLVRGLSAEAGITHVDVRKDLDIRKDIAVASLQYEFVSGYAAELRYDLFSYDDLVSYQRNYAANVVTLSFSKKFGTDYSED
jgi:hypothetical protein